MLTSILLCVAAAAQGQYSYPSAAPYPPAIRVEQPVTHAIQPVHSGRLQAVHFRSGPYPPPEPVLQSPSTAGPYPPSQPIVVVPVSSGPYPPALPSIEGGEISPVEQDSPRVDHATYSLPSLSSPGQLQSPTRSYPLQPERLESTPISYPISPYHQSPLQPKLFQGAPALRPSQYTAQFPNSYSKSPYKQGSSAPSYPTNSIPNQPHATQSYPSALKYVSPISSYPSHPQSLAPNQLELQPNQLRNAPASYITQHTTKFPITNPKYNQLGSISPSHPTQSVPDYIQSYPSTPNLASPVSSYPSYPSPQPSPKYETPSIPQSSPELFQSGGDVSPDELEIPPNSQINLQDKRLQYSHGFSDDKGTAVREQGSLLSTNGGWEYVIAKKGSYSYTSPEGKLISVKYIADHNGYRVIP